MTTRDIEWYIRGVLDNNRKILAKTITLIESSLPAHRERGREIVDRLLPHTGRGIRLGVTGVPGAGKSTFIESLGMYLIGKGNRVAVLAVDPSSTRSGGSILADKTRMERLSVSDGAFIRPSPSGGTLGGVADKTRETLLVCEAAGFDVVIVETVGVGQSETAVASMVDFFLVLLIAGAGDELQGIKKGVMELADAIAINKADGGNEKAAEKARKEYENALHLLRPISPSWSPPVMTTSSKESTGIDEIWNTVLRHRRTMEGTGEFTERRKRQAVEWMWSMVRGGLRDWFMGNPMVKEMLPEITRDVEKGIMEPTIAASKLLYCLKERT